MMLQTELLHTNSHRTEEEPENSQKDQTAHHFPNITNVRTSPGGLFSGVSVWTAADATLLTPLLA